MANPIVDVTTDRAFVCRMAPDTQQDLAILNNQNISGAVLLDSITDIGAGVTWYRWSFPTPGTWKVTQNIKETLTMLGWVVV